MTAQLKWPSTNQNTAWRTFLVVGDMRERVSHAGTESRIIASGESFIGSRAVRGYSGAFDATMPRLAMLSPFFSEGTALT